MVRKSTHVMLDSSVIKSLKNKRMNISSLIRNLLKTYNEHLNKESNKNKTKKDL